MKCPECGKKMTVYTRKEWRCLEHGVYLEDYLKGVKAGYAKAIRDLSERFKKEME